MSKANGRQNRRTTIPWQKSRGGHPKERLKSVFTVGPTAGFSSSADQLLSLHSTVHIGAFWSRSCPMTIEIKTSSADQLLSLLSVLCK